MIIDLLGGKENISAYSCNYKILGDYCCENMEVALTWGHLISNGTEMEVPDYNYGDDPKSYIGGLSISHCPWCGKKIKILNPFEQYWTAKVLDKLAPDYMFWF